MRSRFPLLIAHSGLQSLPSAAEGSDPMRALGPGFQASACPGCTYLSGTCVEPVVLWEPLDTFLLAAYLPSVTLPHDSPNLCLAWNLVMLAYWWRTTRGVPISRQWSLPVGTTDENRSGWWEGGVPRLPEPACLFWALQ